MNRVDKSTLATVKAPSSPISVSLLVCLNRVSSMRIKVIAQFPSVARGGEKKRDVLNSHSDFQQLPRNREIFNKLISLAEGTLDTSLLCLLITSLK